MLTQLRVDISNILDQFLKEELGNRLSQFSILALKYAIVEKLDKEIKETEDKGAT